MQTDSPPTIVRDLHVEPRAGHLVAVCFTAMASPCEVLLPEAAHCQAREFGALVAQEAWRVEQKYSRYRADSITAWLHENRGQTLTLDEETVALLDFARSCYEVSEGLFDVTSGILRRAWTFDGSDRLPDSAKVAELLPLIGLSKVYWDPPRIRLPVGMEIDFGGIGKEYAVDRAFQLLSAHTSSPFLINFGGDMRATQAPGSSPWQVGIERPESDREACLVLDLQRGALATSGDSRRYLVKGGVRYGHILDPRSGWPVPGAPRSATVAAGTCTEAGLLSTLALLKGSGAKDFLEQQGVRYWLVD